MNLVKYEAFVKISEMGNITYVAKELGYSQPGISHMLDSLEAEFGFPLLIREKNSIRLTENGKKILFYCKQVIENEAMLQDMVAQINGLISGSISLGAISSTLTGFVPKLVCCFSASHPNIKVHIQEDSVSGLKEQLQFGQIDLAFTTNDIPRGFFFWPLFHDTICLVVNKNHPIASYSEVPIHMLDGAELIMPFSGWDDNVLLVQNTSPFEPNVTHYVASDMAAISMVQEGMGIYILSKLLCTNLPDSVIAKEFVEPVSRPIGVISKPLKVQSPAVKEFVQVAQKFVNTYMGE